MPRYNSVVLETTGISEEDFHSAMAAGLLRAQRSVSQKMLAFVMDITPVALKNIFKGGSTDPKRLWDVLTVEPTALDDIAELYDRRIVHKDAICSTDRRASAVLVAALKKSIEAEADGYIDHNELLAMEAELRAVRGVCDTLLERITEIRRPRAA